MCGEICSESSILSLDQVGDEFSIIGVLAEINIQLLKTLSNVSIES